jgi:tRNA (guanine-N7-)-methyltransferase
MPDPLRTAPDRVRFRSDFLHFPVTSPPPPTAGRYDTAPGVIAVPREQIPPLPDDLAERPHSGRLDLRAWFKDPAQPVELEIGCGKGTFILAEAQARPKTNFLGIEWEGEYFAYTADRLRRAAVTNARMLHADATEFLRWRVPDGMLAVIHLYFSDPWPKAKHHKNRVIQHRFLAEAWRTLVPGGELRVVTDHDDLWAWDDERFAVWTDAARFAAWRASGAHDHVGRVPDAALPPVAVPFERLPFAALERLGKGAVVGTNYERKKCLDRPPHASTLRKVAR